jgi:hypothetical protein
MSSSDDKIVEDVVAVADVVLPLVPGGVVIDEALHLAEPIIEKEIPLVEQLISDEKENVNCSCGKCTIL